MWIFSSKDLDENFGFLSYKLHINRVINGQSLCEGVSRIYFHVIGAYELCLQKDEKGNYKSKQILSIWTIG